MSDKLSRVESLQGTTVTVSFESPAACGGCRSKSTCGTAPTREIEISAELAARLRPGDSVVLSLPDGASLRAAVIAYVLPLGGFLAGFGLAAAAGVSDGATMLCGVAGLFAGFLLARLISLRMRQSLQPEVCGPR